MKQTNENQPRADDTTVDATLKALADEERRTVVQYLAVEVDGQATFDELVEYVDTGCSKNHPTETVRARLYHTALPTLEASNLIAYESERETVQYQSNALAEHVLAHVDG